jgi:HlyD family secretion protein
MKSLLTLLVLFGVAAGGGGLWYWHRAAHHDASFRTAAVERGELLAIISATGTLEPEEVIDVGAQVAGQIKTFGRDPRNRARPIDYGSPVEEGTVLAQLDDALFRSRVTNARANLQRAEADLQQMQAKHRQTERDWDRARNMASRHVIADADYDQARAAEETAAANLRVGEAAVAQAKAGLEETEINLGYTTIRSPVKGVIVDRRVNVGQTVVASLNAPSLFLIAKDLKRMQVWASVNEADIGSIHAGQAVRFTVDAYPAETFPGTVSQVRLNASMTQNVVTYTVVVEADNSHGKLLPYLTANLQFEVNRHGNVLMVPNAALRWHPQVQLVAPAVRDDYAQTLRRKAGDRGPTTQRESSQHATVWVEDEGFVRPVKVRTGLSDGAMTEVLEGDLDEGTALVVGETHADADAASTNPLLPQLSNGKRK